MATPTFPKLNKFSQIKKRVSLIEWGRTWKMRVHTHWGMFPHSAMETIVLSLICYSLHHSTERCRIGFMGHYSGDFHRGELSLEHGIRFDRSVSLVEHPLRLKESLLDHSIGSRVMPICRTRTYFPSSSPCSLTFRAIMSFSIPTFRVILLCLMFMAIQFSLAFRAVVSSRDS